MSIFDSGFTIVVAPSSNTSGSGLTNPLTENLDLDGYNIESADQITANLIQFSTGLGVITVTGGSPQYFEVRAADSIGGFAIGLGGLAGTDRDVWPGTQSSGYMYNPGSGALAWKPQNAANLEFLVSDGSGGFVASGLETTTATSPGPHIRPIGDGISMRLCGSDSVSGVGGDLYLDGGSGGIGPGKVKPGTMSDYSGVDSISASDRKLYRDDYGSPSAAIDWAAGKCYDAAGGETIDFQNYILSVGGYTAISWNNRQGIASDGSTVALDWNTQGSSISDLSTSTGDSNVDATNAVVNLINAVLRQYKLIPT